MAGTTGLLDTLRTLRRQLDGELFPLSVGDVAADRHARGELAGQIDDYLLPRLETIDAPLLAVVGGSTGAGKSTLVNSLVGADVTVPGVLRPTTLGPTLVASPADEDWFVAPHVLPGLPRLTGHGRGEPGALRVVTAPALPAGIALADAPDIDSVVTANRQLAAQLLAAADLWLFITSAARYADEVPWGFLRSARERSTALAVILNRVPPDAMEPVRNDLARLLAANGLGGVRLFTVPEVDLPEGGRLPARVVQPIVDWLGGICADTRARAGIVRQTLSGALDSLAVRVPALAGAVERQRRGIGELRESVEHAYDAGLAAFDDGMSDGSLLRGEVLARWQDFVGTGELMRSLESRVGRVRDRIVALFTARAAPDTRLRVALGTGIETLIRAAADRAAERSLEEWSSLPAGRDLLDRAGVVTAGRLGRASATLPDRAAGAVRDWQGYVLELVRSEGADRRTTARLASLGVNGTGLLLMLVTFASTGGLTGIEVGIAGGTSVLSQKLLEAIFGDQAVRVLAQKARDDLRCRVAEVLDEEMSRFTTLLDGLGPAEETARALRESARAVREGKRTIETAGFRADSRSERLDGPSRDVPPSTGGGPHGRDAGPDARRNGGRSDERGGNEFGQSDTEGEPGRSTGSGARNASWWGRRTGS
ncbi:GTPase domain-containing protein [Thermopolyspora sp. NPDC052614]|uniref:GTPase domain-containing protein n=1 Tax=Thermopolyspora sp. NPDC052614 TaxID=3155682 RepID=UPI003444DF61